MLKQVYDATWIHIGTFDGEYVYNFHGKIQFRIDGHEVYSLDTPANYLGVFENSEARKLNGSILFHIEE